MQLCKDVQRALVRGYSMLCLSNICWRRSFHDRAHICECGWDIRPEAMLLFGDFDRSRRDRSRVRVTRLGCAIRGRMCVPGIPLGLGLFGVDLHAMCGTCGIRGTSCVLRSEPRVPMIGSRAFLRDAARAIIDVALGARVVGRPVGTL